jgi:hypothetical protein
MTRATYTVPDNPADPEAAALKLIVRMPAEVLRTPISRQIDARLFCPASGSHADKLVAQAQSSRVVSAARLRSHHERDRAATRTGRRRSSSPAIRRLGADASAR